MAKRIGVLGGISHESTARFYSLIHEKYYSRMGDYHYPEVMVYSLNFQRFTDYENTDRAAYIDYIMQGVRGLEAAGAEFIVMAANSPHAVYGEVSRLAWAPVLSIAEATLMKAHSLNLRRLLLLGIKFTMQSTFYQEAAHRHDVQIVTPMEKDQDEVDRIVFEELVLGVHSEKSRAWLRGIIEAYPVDGVILGCTELPLLLRHGDSHLPLLDTLDIHVEAALDYALG